LKKISQLNIIITLQHGKKVICAPNVTFFKIRADFSTKTFFKDFLNSSAENTLLADFRIFLEKYEQFSSTFLDNFLKSFITFGA